MIRRAAAVLSAALILSPLTAYAGTTAQSPVVYGHRIKEGPATGTVENTLTALTADHQHGVRHYEADIWNLATGQPIIWHDANLCRIADPATIPDGLPCTTKVRDLTLTQFQQLRTRGGAPGLTLRSLIRHTGRWHMHGIIEVKYAPLDPAQIMGWVHRWGAHVSFYGTPHLYRGHCYRTGVQLMRDAGAQVGLKVSSACPVTLAESAAFGDSYVIGPVPDAAYVKRAHALGEKVGNYNASAPASWDRLASYGVDWLLVPHPRRAIDYLRARHSKRQVPGA